MFFARGHGRSVLDPTGLFRDGVCFLVFPGEMGECGLIFFISCFLLSLSIPRGLIKIYRNIEVRIISNVTIIRTNHTKNIYDDIPAAAA